MNNWYVNIIIHICEQVNTFIFTNVNFGVLNRKVVVILSIIMNLLQMLEKKNLKQTDLCSAININTSTMTNWKNRNTDPPAKYIIPICEFLQVSPYFLLTGNENNLPAQELSTDERRLLHMYSLLSDMEKGEILGELKAITSNRENIKKNDNLQTVLIAARSSDHHPPELVTGDFSDIINAPDATDEY